MCGSCNDPIFLFGRFIFRCFIDHLLHTHTHFTTRKSIDRWIDVMERPFYNTILCIQIHSVMADIAIGYNLLTFLFLLIKFENGQ